MAMTVWVVRAGGKGDCEEDALRGDFVTIGWNELGDLTPIRDKDSFARHFRQVYSRDTPGRIAVRAGEVWAFRKRIEPGHLVVLPRMSRTHRSLVAVGRVTRPYCYRNDLGERIHHTLPVQWLRTDIPRSHFPQDVQRAFGGRLAVYRIKVDNVEEQILAALSGNQEGGAEVRPTPTFRSNEYGEFINFRGLLHAPLNELGVVFLFGMICKELGFVVESVKSGFPDCDAKREVRPGKWQRVRIEFEFRSRTFRAHGHDPTGCDVIVCWKDNWPNHPKGIEVVELKSEIQRLGA